MSKNTSLLQTETKTDISNKELLKLKMSGRSYREIELLTGIPHETIFSRISKFLELIDRDKADIWRDNKDTMLSNAEYELLCDVMDTKKRAKSTQGNAAYALDKVNNIRRLEAGLSTSNVSYHDICSEEKSIAEEIRRLQAQLGVEVDEETPVVDSEVVDV